MMKTLAIVSLIAVAPAVYTMAEAQTNSGMMQGGMMMPTVSVAGGRKLFASKACVVCHCGIGGKDAPALDASTMPGMTNPFDFVANMWRGSDDRYATRGTGQSG